MKNFFLLALCASLFLGGCEKDDGLRAVSIEIELDAVPISNNTASTLNNNAISSVALITSEPDTLRFLAESTASTVEITKKIVQSEDAMWAVGTVVNWYLYVDGRFDGNSSTLPCDITVRIKADTEVLYSYTAKKGDQAGGTTNGTFIVR